tara:strand:+ start:801 stop:1283 length:483 start_codon:yes stop_codon:yes gene_type:complete
MNVVINIPNFDIVNSNLLDSKKNIITTDGIFTKIIYSTPTFIMNGIFFYFPISVDNIINSNGRYFINFNPNSKHNNNIIKDISIIEDTIINFYKKTNIVDKNKNFLLRNQLYSGNIKVYKDSNDIIHNFNNKQFILKISGIWENRYDFGITYKIIVASHI